MTKTFQTLGVVPAITDMLKQQGIVTPTPVQEQSIPSIFKGRDILAKAQTGTGKTYAFLLPALQQIKIDCHYEQVLIIAPTRELAKQIATVAETLAPALSIDVLSLIGGKTIENQLQKLHRHPHIIIGTPGRLLDHCRRNSLNLEGVSRIVVDEADQMLQSGFLDEVDMLISMTPKKRQLLFFSATIPEKIKGLAKKHMTNPLVLNILSGQTIALENISQKIYMLDEDKKLNKLCAMLQEMNPYLAMVFCNTKERTAELAGQLAARGFNIGELHGDMTQGRRTQVMRDFAKAKTQILVTTDIAARGIDIEGITHVFNYDVPHDVDYYIHRIGRTGRAGNDGLAIMYATAADTEWVRRIERNIKATITKYTANGKIKVHAQNAAPKRVRTHDDARPASTYQATKKKAHKAKHQGSNNLKRRNK
jgi:ATP-dependent RNA helicase DeaD